MGTKEIKGIQPFSPVQLFEWFTTEVINCKEIWEDDTLSTAMYRVRIWELARREGADCSWSPYDAKLVKKVGGERRILLIFEHENAADWSEIEKDFKKLVNSKSHLRFGVFYIHEGAIEEAEKRLRGYLKKMRKIILTTSPRQGPGEE